MAYLGPLLKDSQATRKGQLDCFHMDTWGKNPPHLNDLGPSGQITGW